MTPKQQIMESLKQLPDEASYEDAMERIYFLYKIERGIEQAESEQKVSPEEARQRMAQWLQ